MLALNEFQRACEAFVLLVWHTARGATRDQSHAITVQDMNDWISVFQNCAESLLMQQKEAQSGPEQSPEDRAADLEAKSESWYITDGTA